MSAVYLSLQQGLRMFWSTLESEKGHVREKILEVIFGTLDHTENIVEGQE